MKQKLLVFAGKPGVGKTTVIQNLFPGHAVVDVMPFVMQFQIDGYVDESKTELGYKNMYQHLSTLTDPIVVLEIGTNHPKLNVDQLVHLTDRFDISIFLCEVSLDTNRRRAIERGMRQTTEAFERRLARDFPNTFVAELQKTQLTYSIVNMEGTPEDTVKTFKNLLLV